MEFDQQHGSSDGGAILLNACAARLDRSRQLAGCLGHALDEIVGKHHHLFVKPAYAASPEYARFWSALNGGKPQNDLFERVSTLSKGV